MKPRLTRRQWVVLCLWVSGATRRQIAQSLGVTENTVRTMIARISRKCGISGRIEAAIMGVERDRPPVADTPDLARGA